MQKVTFFARFGGHVWYHTCSCLCMPGSVYKYCNYSTNSRSTDDTIENLRLFLFQVIAPVFKVLRDRDTHTKIGTHQMRYSILVQQTAYQHNTFQGTSIMHCKGSRLSQWRVECYRQITSASAHHTIQPPLQCFPCPSIFFLCGSGAHAAPPDPINPIQYLPEPLRLGYGRPGLG